MPLPPAALPSVREVVAGELRAHMARQRITQMRLSSMLGRPQTWLSRRLACEVAFTVDDFVAICALLDVNVMDVLGEDL